MSEMPSVANLDPSNEAIAAARLEVYRSAEAFAAPGHPIARVFEYFDPAIAEMQGSTGRLEAYSAIFKQNLDFRRDPDGNPRERQAVTEDLTAPREVVGPQLWDTLFDVGEELGLVGDTQLQDGYQAKCIGILGGPQSAINNRTRYALEQIESHSAEVGSFDFLVTESEADHALEAAGELLGIDIEQSQREEHDTGSVVTFTQKVNVEGKEVPVRLVVAKPPEGSKLGRATTKDTMRLWGSASNAGPDDQLVAVTTDIYTGFQGSNARELITWDSGASVRVIGHSAEWAGGQRFARQIGQELGGWITSSSRILTKAQEEGISHS